MSEAEDDRDRVLAHFRAASVSSPSLEALVAGARIRSFDALQRLVQAGAPAPSVFFVLRGVARLYLARADGREFNKAFHREGQFTGSHAASCTGQLSVTDVEALEPMRTLEIPWPGLESIAACDPAMQRYLRAAAERLFWAKEAREAQLLTMTASERYARLLAEEGWLLDRVPLRHVASYLGITDVSLSRIRSRRRSTQKGGGLE